MRRPESAGEAECAQNCAVMRRQPQSEMEQSGIELTRRSKFGQGRVSAGRRTQKLPRQGKMEKENCTYADSIIE